jgi:hypothetical protein
MYKAKEKYLSIRVRQGKDHNYLITIKYNYFQKYLYAIIVEIILEHTKKKYNTCNIGLYQQIWSNISSI